MPRLWYSNIQFTNLHWIRKQLMNITIGRITSNCFMQDMNKVVWTGQRRLKTTSWKLFWACSWLTANCRYMMIMIEGTDEKQSESPFALILLFTRLKACRDVEQTLQAFVQHWEVTRLLNEMDLYLGYLRARGSNPKRKGFNVTRELF